MNGKTLCSVTGSTPTEKIKKEYATTVKLFEQDTYSSTSRPRLVAPWTR